MIVISARRIVLAWNVSAVPAAGRIRVWIVTGGEDRHIELASRHISTFGIGTEERTSGKVIWLNINADLLQVSLDCQHIVHAALSRGGLNAKREFHRLAVTGASADAISSLGVAGSVE